MSGQAAFARALLEPSVSLPPGLCCWTGGEPARRFAVYRNNVLVSLIDALGDGFPVIRAQVGDEFFRAMAGEFVRRAPLASPVLAWYGGGFVGHVASFAPAAGLPWLADLARLEWARVEALHAADAETLPIAEFARWLEQPERLGSLCVFLHPSLQTVHSDYAVVALWAAHQHEDPLQLEAALAKLTISQSEAALVLRRGLEVVVVPVTAATATWCAALYAGQPLDQAQALALRDDAAFDLAHALGLLLRYGLVTALAEAAED